MTPINSTCLDETIGGIFYQNENFWQIGFISTGIDRHSVPEPISSGSPLINSHGRVIGQLLGPGSCADLRCSDPINQRVSYGKFSVSWTGDEATEEERRLDHWLNPGGGTAPLILDGKDGTRIIGPDRICTTNTNFTLQNVPAGQTVTWAVSPTYLFPSTGRTGTGTTATLRAAGTSVSGAATLTYTVDTDCGNTRSTVSTALPSASGCLI